MNNFARPGLGATELPPVNSDDNGKVLGVADGVWAKVAASGGSSLPTDPAQDGTYNLQNTVSSGTSTLSWASGGSSGGVLVVNMSNDGQGTLDKTAAEIFEASKSGTVLIKEAHEPTPGVTNWVEAYKTITISGIDSSGSYSFCWVGDGEILWWSADSGTAYPTFE